jgi:hypothetical protein
MNNLCKAAAKTGSSTIKNLLAALDLPLEEL